MLAVAHGAAASAADSGLSPHEAWSLGYRANAGAFSIYDPNYCSWSAGQRLVGHTFRLANEYIDSTAAGPRFVRDHANLIAELINHAFHALDTVGDTVIKDRHVCVGMFDYPQMNMKSYFEGYILLDPKFMSYMFTLPAGSSMEFVVYHEFAHQLQYWYNVDYSGSRNSRLRELTADCVGAALEVLSRIRFNQGIDMNEGKRIIYGVAQIANRDFDNADFHGTPVNRARSAAEGIRIVSDQLTAHGTVYGTTGGFLIDKCDQFIKSRDRLWGSEDWPDASF